MFRGVDEARRIMDAENPTQPPPRPSHPGRARGRRGYRPQPEEMDEECEKDGVRWQMDRIERESGVALPDNLMYLFDGTRQIQVRKID